MSRHYTNLCSTTLSRSYDSWAIWSNKSHAWSVVNIRNRLYHVEGRNSLSNTDNYSFSLDAIKGISCLHNGFSGKWRRDIDDSCVGISGFYCLRHRVPHWEIFALQFYCLTAFAGGTTSNNICAVFHHLVGMKHTLFSSNPLDQYFCIFFNPNCHY